MRIPLDDTSLGLIEHALGARVVSVGDDGPVMAGADFTLSDLLDFWSGYDPALLDATEDPDVYVYRSVLLSERDLIQALVTELRMTRKDLACARQQP